eukprot:757147_1
MFLKLITAAALISSVLSDDVFQLGTPTFNGSGCPKNSVSVTTASDGKSVSVLFSKYFAETTSGKKTARKACSLAVPVDVEQGYSIGIFKVEYRGYAYVPDNGEAKFAAEYFFAGARGPKVQEYFYEDEDNFYNADQLAIQAMVFSSCGASTIFRINTSIQAKKDDKYDDEVGIGIDSIDTTVQSEWRYYFKVEKC